MDGNLPPLIDLFGGNKEHTFIRSYPACSGKELLHFSIINQINRLCQRVFVLL
jgi:hypothetical protein